MRQLEVDILQVFVHLNEWMSKSYSGHPIIALACFLMIPTSSWDMRAVQASVF